MKPSHLYAVLLLLSVAQLVYVPIVAHGKRLGGALWFLVTALWMGGGYVLLSAVLLPMYLLRLEEERAPAWILFAMLAYAIMPTVAVVFDPARDDGPKRREAGGWRGRIGR